MASTEDRAFAEGQPDPGDKGRRPRLSGFFRGRSAAQRPLIVAIASLRRFVPVEFLD